VVSDSNRTYDVFKEAQANKCAAAPLIIEMIRGISSDVDVHSTIVIMGYVACLVSLIFCVAIVMLPPGPTLENGALRYISEGLDVFCGWSNVVMGTTSMIILMCQLVAAAFMRNKGNAGMWALLQAIGWNTVSGVSSTGWTLHYIALGAFLLGNIVFNYITSKDAAYGSRFYRTINTSSIVFTILFMSCVLSTKVFEDLAQLRSLAVAIEFVLMASILVQTLCMVHAIDSYHVIHLRFEHTSSA
jgi:hypothetical protein